MSHRARGLFRVLEHPAAYLAVQKLIGGDAVRRRFVDEHVRPFAGARILDAGCGTGTLLEFLPGEVGYVGFDMSPPYIEAAAHRYGNRGRFICARVGESLGNEADFDFVVALALLHHLDDGDARSLLGHAVRVLRPGGTFVSIDATLYSGQGWIARTLARADRGSAVRSPEEYRKLMGDYFERVDDLVASGMLRVPYNHYIARAYHPRLA